MKFLFSQILELPFMMNIPNERYLVRFEDRDYHLELDNDLYAVVKEAATTPSVMLLASRKEALSYSKSQFDASVIKLRSVLTLNLVDTPENRGDIKSKEFYENIKSEISRKGEIKREDTEKAANELIRAIISNESAELDAESLKIYSRARFKTELGYHFINLCNYFIKHYCVAYEDRFAQEISLHDICETTCGGVLQIRCFNGNLLENSTLVGKVPPILKKCWFNHKNDKAEEFKNKLSSSIAADEINMLIIRAWNMFERGAYRSAIIESSSALEAEISIQIKKSGIESGKTLEEMQQLLFDNQRFEQRCKKLMKEYCGFTIPELDNVLWSSVKVHRDNLRHKIAHSAAEPSAEEVEAAIKDFSDLIEMIRKKIPN
ncbi:hypothetical protein [Alteromonas portus]|uniref:hypothetical protein n=1 Tax=Alteromonas portus TaxID=2565549 RepID=UPI003BF7FF53